MRRLFSYLMILCCATSAKASTLKYATIDYEYVIQQSKSFAHAEKAIEHKRKAFFDEARRNEAALTKQRTALEKECTTLSKEVCETKMRANTESFHNLNNTYRAHRTNLNESFLQATAKIEEALQTVIEDIVHHSHYTIVFHKRMLVYSEASDDITSEVLKKLDAKLPTVSVTFAQH